MIRRDNSVATVLPCTALPPPAPPCTVLPPPDHRGMAQVNLYGPSIQNNGDSVDAITLKMRQDHWKFFNVEGISSAQLILHATMSMHTLAGTLHQVEVLLGHTPQKLVLSTSKQGYTCVSPRSQHTREAEPVFTFKFCNILQNIAGNNTTLHRCLPT